MDPSAILCQMYDTLKENRPIIPKNIWFVSDTQIVLTPDITAITTSSSGVTKTNDFTVNQTPFLSLSRKIFDNDNAIVLADIDTVNHITSENFTFDKKTSDQPFSYCTTIKDFRVYLDYRFLFPIYYIVDNGTFTSAKINLKNLKHEQITAIILQKQPKGLDLVICEIETVALGLACVKAEGNVLIRGDAGEQLLFLLAQCFGQILVFVPITDSETKYIICKKRKQNIQTYYQLLLKRAKNSSLFVEQLSEDFKSWLDNSNNLTNKLSYQPFEQYNINKFEVICNLSENI